MDQLWISRGNKQEFQPAAEWVGGGELQTQLYSVTMVRAWPPTGWTGGALITCNVDGVDREGKGETEREKV